MYVYTSEIDRQKSYMVDVSCLLPFIFRFVMQHCSWTLTMMLWRSRVCCYPAPTVIRIAFVIMSRTIVTIPLMVMVTFLLQWQQRANLLSGTGTADAGSLGGLSQLHCLTLTGAMVIMAPKHLIIGLMQELCIRVEIMRHFESYNHNHPQTWWKAYQLAQEVSHPTHWWQKNCKWLTMGLFLPVAAIVQRGLAPP